MRKLKFRAWDRKQERMLYSQIPEEQGKREYYPFVFEIGFSHWHISDLVLMQHIGLNDKNGKEIYEGDIVNIQHPDDKCGDFENTNGLVFWSDHEGVWYHGNESGRSPKRMWEHSTVIGNIYETPDLLKSDTSPGAV